MAMTEAQNEAIRTFAATNPTPDALAAAKAQYGVSDADYENAINPYAGWNQHFGTNLGTDGLDRGVTPVQYADAQSAAAANPNVVVGPTPMGTTAGQMLTTAIAPNATPPISINPATTTQVGPLTTVPGTTTGSASPRPAYPAPFQQPAVPAYHTPMLDALYQGQQQRMTSPAPSFNFQAQPPAALKDGGSVGALSRVIKHGI